MRTEGDDAPLAAWLRRNAAKGGFADVADYAGALVAYAEWRTGEYRLAALRERKRSERKRGGEGDARR